MDDTQLQTLWQQRQFNDRIVPLGQPLAILMKHQLARRVRQVGSLAKIWDQVVPEALGAHTALESFKAGVLTVMVDSASHRFQLRLLLDGGLTRQIQEQFTGALNKVRLVPGQFSSLDESGQLRYEL